MKGLIYLVGTRSISDLAFVDIRDIFDLSLEKIQDTYMCLIFFMSLSLNHEPILKKHYYNAVRQHISKLL